MKHSEVYKLTSLAECQSDAVVSNTIVKKESGTVTVFAFDQQQGLSEHSTPFDALVQILEGTALIIIDGITHECHAGDTIIMPANVPHAVKAKTAFKMMLIMIRE